MSPLILRSTVYPEDASSSATFRSAESSFRAASGRNNVRPPSLLRSIDSELPSRDIQTSFPPYLSLPSSFA